MAQKQIADVMKAKKAMQQKSDELATIRDNYKQLIEKILPDMYRKKENFLDCGKHGVIEMKREGKMPKDQEWRMACYTEFFKDTQQAARLIDFERAYKKRIKAESYEKNPKFSLDVCTDPAKATKLRVKYTPGQSLFDEAGLKAIEAAASTADDASVNE